MLLNVIVVWGTIIIGKPIIGNFSEMSLDINTLIVTVIISIIVFGILFVFFLKIKWAVFLERFFVKIRSFEKIEIEIHSDACRTSTSIFKIHCRMN